ncbi:MAG TPA: MBL fold metallo-hydrolase [Gemmatimonadaceae bacterium]|nr:MBL fold metallo-hydrolase [Gemmatimonadaceae bacterium]
MNERPAHHASDGRFRNPWPDSGPHSARDIARLMWTQLSSGPSVRRGSFPAASAAFLHPRAGSDEATATWMGHSTTLLQVGGMNILTDPMWSENAFPVQGMGPRRVMPPPIPLDALPPIDIVLQSHNHYDHLDAGTVRRIAAMHPRATWVAPLRLGATLRRLGVREVVELDWWQEADVRGIGITATPACHFSGRGPFDRNRTLWCGFALRAGSRRAWFAADTAYHPEFGLIGERCGPFDLVLMPIGAYEPRWFMRIVHVDPDEAVQAYRDACAAWSSAPAPTMLAIHWGTFRLTAESMDEPPLRARAAWDRAGLPGEALWIAAFGETRSW